MHNPFEDTPFLREKTVVSYRKNVHYPKISQCVPYNRFIFLSKKIETEKGIILSKSGQDDNEKNEVNIKSKYTLEFQCRCTSSGCL